MSRQNPKRTSRTNTPRPRKIAGAPAAASHPAPALETSEETSDETSDETLLAPAVETPADTAVAEPDPEPVETPPGKTPGKTAGKTAGTPTEKTPEKTTEKAATGLLASPRVTRVLIGVLAVLTVVLVLQLVWLVRHQMIDPPEAPKTEDGDGQVVVPPGTPVVPTSLAVQEGVDAAAEAARLVSTRSWDDYEAGVDAAAELMTPTFEPQFRETAADVKDQYVAQKTVLEARVVAQGVVRANDTELEALVFLNQYVVRGEGKNPGTNYTPYRALLTMVHTDEGWLVDNIETE